MTPYEIGCDELAAYVPTWGFGRKFEGGASVTGLPEQSLSLLIGLCVSAPAGPLSSYLATIQRNLPTGFIGDGINGIASGIAKLWGKHETEVFENHHPLHASNEWNPLFHYTPTPQGTPRPPGIENSPRIHLIDGGMVSAEPGGVRDEASLTKTGQQLPNCEILPIGYSLNPLFLVC